MKKEIVAPSKTVGPEVTVISVNGVIVAACGCGAGFSIKDYKFTKVPKKTKNQKPKIKQAGDKSFMAPQASCDCGGTLLKIQLSEEGLHAREYKIQTHHSKRTLPKHHRATVRGAKISTVKEDDARNIMR